MSPETITDLRQISDKVLVDLKTWLEPWLLQGGVGIRFDLDNEGGWLYVVTNNFTEIDYGQLGMLFADLSGLGINLVASHSPEGVATLAVEPGSISLIVDSLGNFLRVDSTGARTRLVVGQTHTVEDHLGAAIFRVDEAGSVHIRTGTSIIADL